MSVCGPGGGIGFGPGGIDGLDPTPLLVITQKILPRGKFQIFWLLARGGDEGLAINLPFVCCEGCEVPMRGQDLG